MDQYLFSNRRIHFPQRHILHRVPPYFRTTTMVEDLCLHECCNYHCVLHFHDSGIVRYCHTSSRRDLVWTSNVKGGVTNDYFASPNIELRPCNRFRHTASPHYCNYAATITYTTLNWIDLRLYDWFIVRRWSISENGYTDCCRARVFSMLGIYFRMIEDKSKDPTWDVASVNVVLYVVIIYFPIISLN